uniref:Uncharacterized protein n=1 Tax=Arundo donax TaxID=35708 RepID=A0A0A9A8V6_ARUDO
MAPVHLKLPQGHTKKEGKMIYCQNNKRALHH